MNWALVSCGLIVRWTNAAYLEHVSAKRRTFGTCVISLIGLVILVASPLTGSFWVAIVAIVFLGSACSFGESVILGFLRSFPSQCTSAWSSGTGIAGVGGSLWYLALSSANLSDPLIFATMFVSIPVYWIAFDRVWGMWKGDVSRGRYQSFETAPDEEKDGNLEACSAVDSMDATLLISRSGGGVERKRSGSGEMCDNENENRNVDDSNARAMTTTKNERATMTTDTTTRIQPVEEKLWDRMMRCLKMCGYYSVHLALVYFFEYVISVGVAASALGPSKKISDSSDYFRRNSYQIFSFCYQFGVLMSRSSLSVVRVQRVWILTALQGANFALWMCQVVTTDLMPLWLQFVAMVYVGLLGGAMYVNVFHLIMSDKSIPAKDMEFCINVVCIFINLGIVMACIFDVVMDNTFVDP